MGAPFAVGDTVRVTFEGKVERIGKIPGDESAVELKINPTNGDYAQYVATNKVDYSVEKIEPPVEVFEVGTVVRGKHTHALKAVTRKGNVVLASGEFTHEPPTSEWFERVSVG